MENVETITISKTRYQELKRHEVMLNCLMAYGVDNWEGYEAALAGLSSYETELE